MHVHIIQQQELPHTSIYKKSPHRRQMLVRNIESANGLCNLCYICTKTEMQYENT